jgi:hypothetical protein
MFLFPVFICFAENIIWGFVGNSEVCGACCVWSIIAECGEREWVGSVEEASKKAAEFTMWTDCNGDESVIAV